MVDASPRRLRILGTSGSGKSRLAAEVARVTGLPRLELDAVFWDADWTHRDTDEARTMVRDFVAAHPDGWVIDGNWTSRLQGLLSPGGTAPPDAVVWLDHPRAVVMSRVIRRTLRRGILREELWHGNRERPADWLAWDPERNIMRWAWVRHPVVRDQMRERIEAGWPVIRLSGQRAVDAWVASLSRGVRHDRRAVARRDRADVGAGSRRRRRRAAWSSTPVRVVVDAGPRGRA